MKKSIIIILLLTIINTQLSIAQKQGQEKIDSLLKELPRAKEDTNKVNLLNNLSFEFYLIKPDKGLEYASLCLTLAQKLNWKKGIADACYSYGINNYSKSEDSKALEYYFKSLKIFEELGNKKGIARNMACIGLIYKMQYNAPKALEYYFKSLKIFEDLGERQGISTNLSNIGSIYSQQSNYPKALEYHFKALKINEELGNKVGMSINLCNIGIIYDLQFNYSMAFEYYFKALKINQELGNKKGIAADYSNIAQIYLNQSNYPRALEYDFKALKIHEEFGDKRGSSINLGNIGINYYFQSDYPRALEYHFKALKINEELGNKNGIAQNFSEIGIVYWKQSEYSKALEYYFKSLKINEELGIKKGIAVNLGNIGIIYDEQSDYPHALEYFFKALKINRELGTKSGLAHNLGNIGELYIKLSDDTNYIKIYERNELVGLTKEINLKRGIDYTLEAVKISEETGELAALIEWYNNLFEGFKRLGNYPKALEYHELFKKTQDSVYNVEKATMFATLDAKRETELKQKEIELLKAIQGLQQAELSNKKWQLWGSFSALFLLVVFSFFVYRERRKSEKLLLNVLPMKIAKRLKMKENPIADSFESASIVFIDIVDFTKSSAGADPKSVLQDLNILYTKLDKIAQKHGLEKIKTIGDCYMAAAGVPEIRSDNAEMAVRFAIEAMELINNGQLTIDNEKQNNSQFSILNSQLMKFRCGIDCGPVVAGVIGENKFIYDIWGDTVNTSARMEEYSEPGRIQVTERFKDAVLNNGLQPIVQFEDRGEIEIKGKGMMRTYFLDSNNKEFL